MDDSSVRQSGLYGFAAVYMNLDVELRYRAVASLLRDLAAGQGSILEVGSGTVSIGRYLGCRVTTVDMCCPPGRNRFADRLQASASLLPFRDQSWDTVCSIDMLEHIPAPDRPQALREMVRVARSKLVVAVPVGPRAFRQDHELHGFHVKQHGSSHRFGGEHIELGLPNRSDIEKGLQAAAKQFGCSLALKVSPNVNLRLRSFYMKLSFHKSVLVRCLYVALFPLSFFHGLLNWGKCYREIYAAKLSKDGGGA